MRAWLQRLGTRFDGVALRPFDWPADGAIGPDWPLLRDWCRAQPALPLAVAQAGPGASAAARAAAVALMLDGSQQLHAARGPWGRIALRLRVKLQDALGGRGAAAGARGIWDSGWVPAERAAWAALAQFQPRRATLIVMQGLPAGEVRRLLAALQARSAGFQRPVRVLLVDGTGAVPGEPAELAVQVLPLPG